MSRKVEFGLLIDYEYCTGCYACQVACAQEHGRPAGMEGIRINEIVQPLPNNRCYLAYVPFPTELCVLCRPRTKKGLKTACEVHCMAQCITFGPIAELAEKMREKPRMVLWTPR
jgi:Fe-S-cluster-containing dehydrogenase component